MSENELERLKEENRALQNKLKSYSSYVDRFNMIIDEIHEWVWEVDATGVYTYASVQVTSVLGYDPKELIGKTPFDFMDADEAERVGKVFAKIALQEKPFSKLKNKCLHKDGHTIYTETSGQPFYDDTGLFLGYRGIDFDRTQEEVDTQTLQDKNIDLEKALYEKHELLLNVTNSISDLLFYKDTEYRYTGCNQAFSNFLGLPIEHIIGKTDYELFPAEFADLFRSMDKRVMEGMQSYSNYEWVKHADGRRLYLLTQKSPLFNTQASLIGMVGIARDLTREHELEHKLKQSSELLIHAQGIAKIGHWDWNIISGALFWSDEIYKIFGYEPQEFGATYDAFLATIHPEDRQRVADAVESSVADHNDYNIFHRIMLPDGKQKIVHEIGHAFYDDTGRAIQMIGTVQDVTEQKLLERDLEQQKEAFEKIFEYSSDGALIAKDGKFVACNQAALKLLGFSSKEEVLSLNPGDISPEFQPDGHRSDEKGQEVIQTCLEKGFNRFEWLHKHKSGEPFWVDVILTCLDFEGETVVHGAWRDITQQKNLERELQQQKEAFEAIFEYSSDGLSLIKDGKFVACNQAVVKMMRASSKEAFMDLHPSQLSPELQPDGRSSYEKAEEMMNICLEKGRNRFEWVHTRANGEEFWAEILLTRLIIDDKPLIHVSWRDISERKFLENTLETSNTQYKTLANELDKKVKEQSAQMIKQSRMAQMGELLSMIAHQWRQPLSSISAVASSIKIKLSLTSDDAISEESRDYLDKQMDDIENLTQTLSNTINDFRTLYKPDKIMKYVHITNPIERALELMAIAFEKDAIKIERLYDSDASVQMHANEIMQVLLNLLKNANDNFLEKSISKPLIAIHTHESEKHLTIDICDNGGGVSEDIIDKIFDPYFSTKDEKNGTGLGLYMSKIIVEQQHKGQLNVYNKNDGVCFTIALPKHKS